MLSLAQLPIEALRTQIGNGFILMILGMAIVFVFLTILVFATKSVSKIVKKFEKEAPKTSSAKAQGGAAVQKASVPQTSEAEVAAAIMIMAAMSKTRN